MSALLPAFLAYSALLVFAGVAKLTAPEATGAALAPVGMGAPLRVVRLMGIAEAALGIACLLHPSTITGVALACAYLSFTGFLLRLRSASAGAGCGCFGDAEAVEAGGWHAFLNLLGAAIGLGTAAQAPSWASVGGAIELAVFGAGVLAASCLLYLAYTALPALWSAHAGAEAPR